MLFRKGSKGNTKMSMATSYRRRCFVFASVLSFFGLVSSSHVQELPYCDFENDFVNGSGAGINDLSRCIALRGSNLSLIHDGCFDRWPEGKCYIYNYNIDFEQTATMLQILDNVARNRDYDTACIQDVRTFVCNYVYPKCDPVTGNYQGICTEDCIDFILNTTCDRELDDLEFFASTSEVFTFSRQCNNTLIFLEQFMPDFVYDPNDCFNISGIVPNVTLAEVTTPPTPTTISLEILLPSVGGVVASLLILAVVLVCLFIKQRVAAKYSLESPRERHSSNAYAHMELLQRTLSTGHVAGAEYAEVNYFQLSSEDVDLVGTNQLLQNALVESDQIEITGDLGEGAFSRVFKGSFKENQEMESIPVAIKTIKNCASYEELKAFLLESALMCTFDHRHVLGLIGICLNTAERSPYLVLPFMENGDLRTYLKAKRDTLATSADTGYPEGLEFPTLVRMCSEIACGMEYLAANKLVHRDLAARNCMVDAQLQVKVADFGLTRDIYATDYYRQSHHGLVPVKWMSLESLHDKISNEKTDVWSYGVTCWEVFSLGRTPYPAIANHEMIDYLEQGFRLKKPALCSENMYNLMYQCWNEDPTLRPTFAEMVKQLYFLQKEEPDNIPLFVSKSCEKLCDETPPNGFIQSGDETLMSAIIAHFHNTPPSSNSQPEEDNAHSQEGYIAMNPVQETNLSSQPEEDNAHSQEGYIAMNPVQETNLSSQPEEDNAHSQEGYIAMNPVQETNLSSQPEEDNAHSQEGYIAMNPVQETNLLSQPEEDNAHSQEGYIAMNPVQETNLSSNLVIENGLNPVNSDHEYVNMPPHHTNLYEDSADISFPSNGLLRKNEHIQVRLESNNSDYVPMHPASSTM